MRLTGERVGNVIEADNGQRIDRSVDELGFPGACFGTKEWAEESIKLILPLQHAKRTGLREKSAIYTSDARDAADIFGLAVCRQVRAADRQGRGRPDQAVAQVVINACCKNLGQIQIQSVCE
jgi:hypothetical protein